jgi:uncharacterized membrane protein
MGNLSRSKKLKVIWISFVILFLAFTSPPSAQSQDSIVRLILFYSPTCPHCHDVITQTLPPLIDSYGGTSETRYIPPTAGEEAAGPSLIGMYGEKLEILYINTLTEVGSDLYWEAVERYQIPQGGQVVPLMIINDVVLTGGSEIPAKFSEQVDAGLSAGGYDWPNFPGLEAAMDNLVDLPDEETQPAESATDEPAPDQSSVTPIDTAEATVPEDLPAIPPLIPELSILDKIKLDPLGNGIAILTLFGMVLMLGYVGLAKHSYAEQAERSKLSVLIPILSFLGFLIAGYLTYVEASGNLAVCGPIGDCNTVQQSQYSRLFGLIPVGLLGLIGYIAISITWFFARSSTRKIADWAGASLFVMTTLGILFSIYLTFLEPFVIGATCAWCISSAVIMTLLFWLTKDAGLAALSHVRGKDDS